MSLALAELFGGSEAWLATDFRCAGVNHGCSHRCGSRRLLHRYTGEDDLRVATHLANRNRPGTEELIGPLVTP